MEPEPAPNTIKPPSFSSFHPVPSSSQPYQSTPQLQPPPSFSSFTSATAKGKERAFDDVPADKPLKKSHRELKSHPSHSNIHTREDRDKRTRKDERSDHDRGSSRGHHRRRHDSDDDSDDSGRDHRHSRKYSSTASGSRHDLDHRRSEAAGTAKRHRHRSRSRSPVAHPRAASEKDYKDERTSSYSTRHPKPSFSRGAAIGDLPTFEKDLFYTDTRGDSQSVKYGQDTSKVPDFVRAGGGRVLGLNQNWRITRHTKIVGIGSGLEVVSKTKERDRYTDDSKAWKAFLAPGRRLKRSSSTQPNAYSAYKDSFGNEQQDFVPLSSTFSKAGELSHHVFGSVLGELSSQKETIMEEDGLQGEGTSDEGSDRDLDDDPRLVLRARNKSLNTHLRHDPADVTAWLELVDLQAKLFDAGQTLDPVTDAGIKKTNGKRDRQNESDADRRAVTQSRVVANVQLSILEKAVSSHTQNRLSKSLALARLHSAIRSAAWDSQKIDREWQRLLRTFSPDQSEAFYSEDSPARLWIEYLSWRQSDWTTFRVADICRSFTEAIGDFGPSQSPNMRSADTEAAQIQILGNYTQMLIQAGYRERAVATLQALLEVNLCRPDDANSDPFESLVRRFESFWDEELPRLADEGARGWTRSKDDGLKHGSTPHISRASEISLPSMHPANRWSAVEDGRSALRQLPAKLADLPSWKDEGDEIDPYSIPVFSDFRDMLFPISSKSGQLKLVDLMLECIGLPSNLLSGLDANLGLDSNNFKPQSTQALDEAEESFWPPSLKKESDRSRNGIVSFIDGQVMGSERASRLSDPDDCPLRSFPVTIESFFPLTMETRCGMSFRFDRLSQATLQLALRLLDQVQGYLSHVTLHLLRLAIEASRNVRSASKLAKKILSEQRENVILWHAYARLEMQAGKLVSARSVFQTALSSSASFDPVSNPFCSYLPALWTAAIDLELVERNRAGALALIVEAARSRFSRPAQELNLTPKELKGLEALQIRHALASLAASGGHLEARCAIVALGVFEYFIQPEGDGLRVSLATFHQHAQTLQRSTVPSHRHILEWLLMMQSRFILAHISSGLPFRPIEVRDALDSALEVFPVNTVLVGHLSSHEMRSKIDNHLRLSLDKQLKRQETRATSVTSSNGLVGIAEEVQWLHAIFVELNLHLGHFSEHAVRRLFERAVNSQAGSSSFRIWRTFLEFEIRICQQGGERTKKERRDYLDRARGVYFRAIKACPGNKAIFMMAFRDPLHTAVTMKELKSIFESMCEKEIRLYVDFNDFLEGWNSDTPLVEEEKNVDSDSESDFDDPFDPNKPYKKRDDRYEQVGGGGVLHRRRRDSDSSSSSSGSSSHSSYSESNDSEAGDRKSGSSKRRRLNPTGLLQLPVELLYPIFVDAHSPSLPMTCRWLREVFRVAPLGVKVEYMLELWHETHLGNLEQWRSQRYPRCRCAYAEKNPHTAPRIKFADRTSALSPGVVPVCCRSHLPAGSCFDPISFAARFGICTPDMLVRLEARFRRLESMQLVLADAISYGGRRGTTELRGVELPKRLFRALKHTYVGEDGEDEDEDEYEFGQLRAFQPRDMAEIGHLPTPVAVQILLLLLTRYGADANSHSGFPLAMCVHANAWALASVLLAFGADPARKESLAVQIAVRKASLGGLKALIERDARTEKRWATARIALDASMADRVPRMPDRFQPDSSLLREAIKTEAWDMVHYFIQERRVVPDMKTLKLMDKKGL